MNAASPWRNVAVLAACQALSMTGASITMTSSALVGQMLAADKGLSTLPLALQVSAAMLTTVPASLLMKRAGRRAGFSLGCALGAAGGALCALAIATAGFALFCLGSALLGAALGCATFYRFAAADHGDERQRSRAMSLVLAGGVVAAIGGPELAKWSAGLMAPLTFAGCFVAIAVLNLAALALVQALRLPALARAERRQSGRPLSRIVRQPAFVVAVGGAMVAYAVMTLVMTATPLAMLACGFDFAATAFVIQWHALGMFAPSFVTGHLINRIGVRGVMATGAALLLGCIAVDLSGVALSRFWAGLVLLGVGWNLLFLGATALLMQACAAAERAKVQAFNDLLVFATSAAASFASGAIHSRIGWPAVNLAVLPPVLLVLAGLLWLGRRPTAAMGVPAGPAVR
ncbi:MAG: MFS transporter [Rhodospirillaceae bacterium]|nr:MFS transporter [Rhodospirillaceae bacterium]